jgi:hypothetical protein
MTEPLSYIAGVAAAADRLPRPEKIAKVAAYSLASSRFCRPEANAWFVLAKAGREAQLLERIRSVPPVPIDRARMAISQPSACQT